MAPLAQAWPEGCSGNGGVASSGSQAGSASVAGFPSVSAIRIAVIGRHDDQYALSFQQLMLASAAASSDSPSFVATVLMMRFQEAPAQYSACSVWSAVRVGLLRAPIAFTSAKSAA